MAHTPLWGDSASVTFFTGAGCHFNSFSLDISQGTTTFYGYGDDWVRTHGTIAAWSGSAAGFAEQETKPVNGSSTNILAGSSARAGASITLTWNTGYTFAGTAICTNANLGNTRLGTSTNAYNFTGDGNPTETWP